MNRQGLVVWTLPGRSPHPSSDGRTVTRTEPDLKIALEGNDRRFPFQILRRNFVSGRAEVRVAGLPRLGTHCFSTF